MNFQYELAKGKFCIPECSVCKKTVWPPAKFCSYCFGTVLLKKEDVEGKILEFSRQNEEYFCLVEFKNTIKIIAKILTPPKVGQVVKISKCGISDGNYFFYVN